MWLGLHGCRFPDICRRFHINAQCELITVPLVVAVSKRMFGIRRSYANGRRIFPVVVTTFPEWLKLPVGRSLPGEFPRDGGSVCGLRRLPLKAFVFRNGIRSSRANLQIDGINARATRLVHYIYRFEFATFSSNQTLLFGEKKRYPNGNARNFAKSGLLAET